MVWITLSEEHHLIFWLSSVLMKIDQVSQKIENIDQPPSFVAAGIKIYA